MHTLVRYAGLGCITLFTFACGSTGTDTPGAGGGTGGSSAGSGGSTAGTGGGATGGTTGSGGTIVDSGGGGPMFTKCWNFDGDAGVDGWAVTYTSAADMANTIPMGDVMVGLNSAEGLPQPGSLELDIPYSHAGQYVGIGLALAISPLDLTGKILNARVKILSGLGDPTDLMSNPGGGKIYVKTSMGYKYAAGMFTNLGPIGAWTSITFDLAHPGYLDPGDAGVYDTADVRELGLQIDTSGTSTSAQPAVVLIDSVCY